MSDLADSSNADLFRTYASVLRELRRREVVRTNNAPAGDYAEWLCRRHFGGRLAVNSEKSFDIEAADGTLIQVKARVVSAKIAPGQRQTSPFRSWDFDAAAFVMLDDQDYEVRQAALVPMANVKEVTTWRQHVNGSIAFMTDALLNSDGSIDITEELRRASQQSFR